MKTKVAVVGGGVIGLSTGLRALDQYPDLDITIISEHFSPNTTGDGSSGVVLPYLPGDVAPEVVTRWFDDTLNKLRSIAWTRDAKKAGVGLLSAYVIHEQHNQPRPFFADALISCRELTKKELSMFPDKYKSGHFITTYFAECKTYLPYLLEKFIEKGGKIIQKRVNDLQELSGIYDVVFNCPGLNARLLVKDDKVYPIRGQLLRVRAPWLKHAIIAGDSYMLPNTDLTIVGGTRTVDDWNTNVDPKDTKTIFDNACKVFPGLQDAEIANVWAGLRPSRNKPRLETETITYSTNKLHIIHNYGHGGSGVTLSWGCAIDAVQMFTELLTKNQLYPKSKL